ncbi:AAA family ATPase [Ectopseudomonas khazarica]|uniref:AAA family ATPase n=1 Tax=Ectopseudomonas khazarica TaxID=2502979 RepID=UPI003B924134
MLKRFEVRNFKNFGENIIFDLTKTNGYEFNKECVEGGVVNKAIIYGYNGVGKSNLGFAIFDLVSHVTDRQKGSDSYKNYLYAGSECEMAEFKYTFSVAGGEIYYEYGKKDQETIIYETIKINGVAYAAIDRRESTRAHINIKGAETLKRDIGDTQISIVQYIKNNTVLEDNLDNKCFEAFLDFVDGMLFFRSLDSNRYIGYEQGSNSIEKDIISKNSVKDFEHFLNEAGISCKLAVMDGEEKAYLAFDFNGKKIRFLDIASQGTRSLTLFYYWYLRLKGGDSKVTFLFVDEFDAFYHYSLSILIIKLLKDVRAQTIVTTHNTSVMTNELLRPDCYFFIDGKGIHSLSNSTPKELREAHNIEKMYRAGAFGG